MSTYDLASLGSALRGLALPVAPYVAMKAWEYYKRYQVAKVSGGSSKTNLLTGTQPVSTTNWVIILLLLFTAAFNLLIYVRWALPAVNVFYATESRMQTEGSVISSRLRGLYGDEYESAPGAGNIDYALLVDRLASATGRALYAVYGTEAYGACLFCRTDSPTTFLFYSIPSIVGPHLANYAIVLFATTSTWSTPNSRQWFTIFSIVSIVYAGLEVYSIYKAPTTQVFMNMIKNSKTLEGVSWVYWTHIHWRGRLLAAGDTMLAVLVFLSASGRAFDAGEATAVRTSKIIKALDDSTNRLRMSILLHTNVVATDPELRDAFEKWGSENEAYEKKLKTLPEMVEARKQAKARLPISMKQMETDFKSLVDSVYK